MILLIVYGEALKHGRNSRLDTSFSAGTFLLFSMSFCTRSQKCKVYTYFSLVICEYSSFQIFATFRFSTFLSDQHIQVIVVTLSSYVPYCHNETGLGELGSQLFTTSRCYDILPAILSRYHTQDHLKTGLMAIGSIKVLATNVCIIYDRTIFQSTLRSTRFRDE